MANLERLDLGVNKIGDSGMQALADALKSSSGALASLTTLYVDAKPAALKSACSSRGITLH